MTVYDYQRHRTATSRVWVEKGKLIQTKDAVIMANVPMMYDGASVEVEAEWQLYDENGRPATGSYRGNGQVVSRGATQYVILGDPYRDATLTEYRVDQDMTAESEKRVGDVVAGVKAAIGDFKPGRRVKAKGQDWLRGYDEAMAYRKRVDR
jgi:hypothetical protein